MTTAWLPGVDRDPVGTDGGSWTREPAIICAHSTEGVGWDGYQGGMVAPHVTLRPSTGEARQHIPLTRAARALEHPAGTPQTNRAGVIQIEIIGTSDRRLVAPGRVYLGDLDDQGCAHLARLFDLIHDATGIPLVSSVTWVDYPRSYGVHASQRLSRAAFAAYRGVLAHQHVPDNAHGDVPLPIDRIIAMTKTASEEDDMTPAEKKQLDQAAATANAALAEGKAGNLRSVANALAINRLSVSDSYRRNLGREATDHEIDYWVGKVDDKGWDLERVLKTIAASDEARKRSRA